MRLIASCFGMLVALTSVATLRGDDWLQFRGPNASGVESKSAYPKTWGANSNIQWQANIPGEGWSAPIVVQGKVFVTTAVSQGPKNKSAEHEWQVICLDESTGKVLWTKVALRGKPRLGTHRDNTYASETAVSDGQHLVVYFGMTSLLCYDLAGNELWKKDLGNYPMQNEWGTSSSPVLFDGLVLVQVDSEQQSFMVALDVKSGEEKWRKAREEKSNWGSPIIWTNSLRSELVTAGRVIRSYNPTTGDLLWQLNLDAGGVSATPSASGDLLVVGSQGRSGSGMFAVKAGGSGDINLKNGETSNASVVWSSKEMGPQKSSPLLYEGYLYLLGNRGGQITCLDAKTGQKIYQDRLPEAGAFWASPWVCNGQIFCTDEKGTTYVLKPGPKLEVLAVNKLPGADDMRFWATSAMANGTLFIRSSNTLFALSERR